MMKHVASVKRFLEACLTVFFVAMCLATTVYGATITVSNNTDIVNGITSSPENLAANPGADGISLREALMAAMNVSGPHTIQFASGLMGTTITLLGQLPEITRDGIAIYGDINGDGQPDITINGAEAANQLFKIKASSITVSGFIVYNFDVNGILVYTNDSAPHVVEAITITGNTITAGWNGIQVINEVSNGTIQNVVISGNTLFNNGFTGVALGGGNEPFASNNLISNVDITGNTITNTGDKISIMIFGATRNGGADNTVRDLVISENTISDLLLISAGNALGCQHNTVENIVIADNDIQVSPCAIEILGGAQDSTSPSQGESTDVSDNVVNNVRISDNTLQGGGIQLVGADGQYRAPQYLAIHNSVENVLIERNLIWGGTAGANGIQLQGGSHGGQENTVHTITIRNNVIVKNHDGAGISLLGGFEGSNNNTIADIDIINNTIAENGNSWAGGININDNNSSSGNTVTGIRIKNTILWGNEGGDAIRGPLAPDVVEFSILGDSRYVGSNGNFYASPQFVDAGHLNYRLGPSSPAVETGNPSSLDAGEIDFDGNIRIYDGNNDGNAVIDIGAYEYGSIPPVTYVLHRDGALWSSDTGWEVTTPPYYPGTGYARALALVGAGYKILHRDGAIYDSVSGWVTSTPPYHPGTDYAVDLKVTGSGETIILHQDGALWSSSGGWTLTAPPYYPGTAYAKALEVRTDNSYVILHRDGAIYDSASGWVMTSPPYYPSTAYAVDMKLEEGGYVILHRDGAVWSTSGGWIMTSPPYYPTTDYARALVLVGDGYKILHRDGAIYDSVDGWNVDTPPYYPGTGYAVDLEVQ